LLTFFILLRGLVLKPRTIRCICRIRMNIIGLQKKLFSMPIYGFRMHLSTSIKLYRHFCDWFILKTAGFPSSIFSRELSNSELPVPQIDEDLSLPTQPELGKLEVVVYSALSSQSDNSEPVTPDSFHQQLLDRVRKGGSLIPPEKRGYRLGQDVDVEVYGLDGSKLGNERFTIEASPGSGFAGQVYRAIPEGGVVFEASDAAKKRHTVALKVLRPRTKWKETFRDILFKLSYQTSFAPRLREEALRSGLIWHELFRTAAGIEFGIDTVITKPFGYYWDGEVASFAEIHEWINGRCPRYEADDQIITRWMGKTKEPPNSEVARKRKFMGDLVSLCHKIGAIGLARQYEWYTFVSQANILTRNEQQDGLSEFIAVDCRPGLAVPFFLPLSPVHAKIILGGLIRGVFATHVNEFKHVDGLIQQLKKDDERYRSGLPNFWHVRTQFLRDKELRQKVREGSIGDWRKLGKVSEKEAWKLRYGSKRYAPYLILDNIPLVGQPLLRLLGNEKYREHVGRIFRNPAYLKDVIEVQKSCDLLEWSEGQRITTKRAIALANSTPKYLFEKVFLSWQPKNVHRLATDAEVRRQLVQNLVVNPARLCISREFRQEWLMDVIEQQLGRGVVTAEQVEIFREQIDDKRMQGFVRDLGVTVGLDAASKILYMALLVYGLSARDFWPLGIAILGPISPSGIAREAYVLAQLIHELPHIIKNREGKLLLTRALGAASAPWRIVGNAFVPLEMFAFYNDMSLLLGDYFVSKMVDAIPVFGGEGKLIENWAFQTAYNLPLSIRRVITEMMPKRALSINEE
jgi:hypothetical protein